MPLLHSIARRAVRSQLSSFAHGRLRVRDGASEEYWGNPGDPAIDVEVLDSGFYGATAWGGAAGAGEAYANGWWTTSDLTGVVRLMLRNREVLDGLEGGGAALAHHARRLVHALRANTRLGARRNIHAHYDLGNDFFAAFLDDTLTYSCALFERPGLSLRDASLAKYARVAALLDLGPDDHVIEIGGGWGGFAMYAASRYGCRITTTTISEEQFRLASDRIARAGLADRVTVLRRDYRDLDGRYDALVSIEMIEAVGHQYYDAYFRTCAALIGPRGRAAIQAITIADDRYERARREVDFIKRHIFPGSCIPSRSVIAAAATSAGLTLVRADEIGLHYAETLRRWRANMRARSHTLTARGYDARLQRLWDFYFAYCEGGFLERAIGAAQFLFAGSAASLAAPPQVPAVADPYERIVA